MATGFRRQSQIAAQGAMLILGTKQPTRLQDRHDLRDEVADTAMRAGDDETIDSALMKEMLDLVGNEARRPDEIRIGAGRAQRELP